MKEPSVPWQNVKDYFVAYQQKKKKGQHKQPEPVWWHSSELQEGWWAVWDRQSRECHRSPRWAASALAPRFSPAGSSKSNPAPNHPPQLKGWGRGGGGGWLSCRHHLQRSRSLRHQRPGPWCHVPPFVPAIPHPTRGHGHSLGRPPGSLHSRRPGGPHLGPGREGAVKSGWNSYRRTGRPGTRARPSGASDTAPGLAGSPGTGLGTADSARHPRELPRTTGSPPIMSKAHIRHRSTAVSSPLAWPGPPSRSAPLPSAALSSTPRTSAPASSPTRQRLPGYPRPFCDARGRGSEHARERGGGLGGAVARMVSRGAGPPRARRADVKLAAAFCAGVLGPTAYRLRPSWFPKKALRSGRWRHRGWQLPPGFQPSSPPSVCFSVPVYKKNLGSDFTSESTSTTQFRRILAPSSLPLTNTSVVSTAFPLAEILYYFLSSSSKNVSSMRTGASFLFYPSR